MFPQINCDEENKLKLSGKTELQLKLTTVNENIKNEYRVSELVKEIENLDLKIYCTPHFINQRNDLFGEEY